MYTPVVLYAPVGKNRFSNVNKNERKKHMSNMGKTTKRLMALRLDLHICKAVERKYRLATDTDKTTAYIRALEDSSRGVKLTPEDYIEIAAEIRANEAKRRKLATKKRGSK